MAMSHIKQKMQEKQKGFSANNVRKTKTDFLGFEHYPQTVLIYFPLCIFFTFVPYFLFVFV